MSVGNITKLVTFSDSVQEPIKMHTLIECWTVSLDGRPLWNPASESVKINTLKWEQEIINIQKQTRKIQYCAKLWVTEQE